MDVKEAIEVLRHMRMSAQDSARTITNDRYLKAELVAEVEADTIAIKALEKQIPKKPNGTKCACGNYLYCRDIPTANNDAFCSKCGQRIDWGE